MSELTPELRADFLEWLRTGSFRGVRLGMLLEEVLKELGPEQTRWESEYGVTLQWNAPPIVLTFDVETRLLWQLEVNLWKREILPVLFDSLTDFSPQAVANYLQDQGISFEVHPMPDTGENDLKFRLAHAIEFSFFDDVEEGQPLELCLIDQTNTLTPYLIITRQ